MAQTTPEPEQIVRDYTEMWNDQDYSRIPDIVSESFVHETPAAPGDEVRGPQGTEAFMREIWSAFPDFEVTIIEMLSSDQTVVAENEFTMTHEGEFDGIPPTGREVEVGSMAKCHVEKGKLQEIREYANMQEFLEQIGVSEERAEQEET